MIVKIDGDHATVWIVGGLQFQKRANGQWLLLTDDSPNFSGPSDPAAKAALEAKFKALLASIEAGKIGSPGDVPAAIEGIVEAPAPH